MAASVRGIKRTSSRSGNENEKGDRGYTYTYLVTTTDRNDDASTVLTAAGLPSVGDFFNPGNGFDLSAVVINRDVQQTASPTEWEVEIEWSTDVEEPPEDENPLNRPADISYGGDNRKILVPGRFQNAGSPNNDQDYEAAILAPNGEPFDPQPEMDIADPTIVIKRNESGVSGAAWLYIANSVNKSRYLGAKPRQLRMKMPQAQRQWHKKVGFYWEVTYTLVFRWETWDIQILNQGTYYFKGGKPADITTATKKVEPDGVGNPIVINLKADGDINKTTDPTFTRLRVYREIDFATLNLV